MKKFLSYISCLCVLSMFWSCKKDGNYPGGTVSSYISVLDLRDIYKGQDVTLTKENMAGADKIAGVVVSDQSGANIPAGLLVVQDARRLGQVRGISVNLGADAAKYVPGDSIIISVESGVLKRKDGLLQLTGVSNSNITKVASGRPLTPLAVKTDRILANPNAYESVLIAVQGASFDASYPSTATYAGDRTINDGVGNLTLHTEATAAWAGKKLPFLSNFTGILFNAPDGTPKLWPRIESDILIRTATAPKIAPVIITGYLTDPQGNDNNYEYVQLMATKAINFSATPFSLVTNNNAGASTPTGVPTTGWATGDLRTYKINITSGSVALGQTFYVGFNKNIWGAGSTDISSSKWFTWQYSDSAGNGFGTKTANLLANSGNVAGIAVFDNITVTEATVPVDVIFYGGSGGSVYTAGPPAKGYRIVTNDYYDESPTPTTEQPYFRQGSNTAYFNFPATANFSKLGGKFNKSTGRWTTARTLTNVVLTATSQVSEIEGGTILE